jgi:hypothetical protein
VYLIQILLPVRSNGGTPFAPLLFAEVAKALTERFGGVTAYTRTPAEGRWRSGERVQEEDVMVVEVMAETLDRHWWGTFRTRLEAMFEQEQVVVRAQSIELL